MDKKKPEVGYNPAPDEKPKVVEEPVEKEVPIEPTPTIEVPVAIIDGADTR